MYTIRRWNKEPAHAKSHDIEDTSNGGEGCNYAAEGKVRKWPWWHAVTVGR